MNKLIKSIAKLLQNHKILLFILILAGFMRLVDIENNPKALYGDELTAAYDAYSIYKTGYSSTGDFLPFHLKMSDNRPPGYVYASIPFVAVFGPTATGIRMLSVLSGIGIVLLLFILGKQLVNRQVGLAAAFLAAISPWAITLSRGGFETNFALFLTLGGLSAFLASKNKPVLLILSALLFAGAIHTYPTYKMTVPLLIAFLVLYRRRYQTLLTKPNLKWLTSSALVLAAALGILVSNAFTSGSEDRFLRLNIFNKTETRQLVIQKINHERKISDLPLAGLAFHNKATEYLSIFTSSLAANHSFEFLFLKGDGNPRHNLGSIGQLYLIEAVFLIFGLALLVSRQRDALYLLGFIGLISALPTALLGEAHALRSSLMLVPLVLISASGLVFLLQKLNKPKLINLRYLLLAVLAIQFVIFAERAYFVSPNKYSSFWSYPAKQATQIALQASSSYQYVILSHRISDIELAFPVYTRVEPKYFINQNTQPVQLSTYRFRNYGNIYTGSVPEPLVATFINNHPGSIIYITSPEEARVIREKQVLGKIKIEIVLGPDSYPSLAILSKI